MWWRCSTMQKTEWGRMKRKREIREGRRAGRGRGETIPPALSLQKEGAHISSKRRRCRDARLLYTLWVMLLEDAQVIAFDKAWNTLRSKGLSGLCKERRVCTLWVCSNLYVKTAYRRKNDQRNGELRSPANTPRLIRTKDDVSWNTSQVLQWKSNNHPMLHPVTNED